VDQNLKVSFYVIYLEYLSLMDKFAFYTGHLMLLGWYFGLDICVGWTKQNMRKEIWYGNLLKVIRFDENEEY
jgi:hypothetical protein